MSKFQNFGRPPGQSRLPTAFSPARGQNSKFRSQHFVCLVVPIPTPLPQTPPEEIGLAETRFFGVHAWPHWPQGPSHLPKNYFWGGKWALKILRQSVQWFKSYGTFWRGHTDRHTDGRTDTHTKMMYLSTIRLFFFAKKIKENWHQLVIGRFCLITRGRL